MRKPLIAVSITEGDVLNLAEEINQVVLAGADMVHIDVVGSPFEDNRTLGLAVCRALNKLTIRVVTSAHLRQDVAVDVVEALAATGVDTITVQAEDTEEIGSILQLINSLGRQAGLALGDGSELLEYAQYFDSLDLLLLLFDEKEKDCPDHLAKILNKLSNARQLIDKHPRDMKLAVKGQISLANITAMANAGADTFVVGNLVFSEGDYYTAIAQLKRAATL